MSDTLLTIDEIAARLDARPRTVADVWIHRHDFPAPVIAILRKRKWRASDVDAWAARGARQPAPLTHGSTHGVG